MTMLDSVLVRQITYLSNCYWVGLLIFLTYFVFAALTFLRYADRSRATFARFLLFDLPYLGLLSSENRKVAFSAGAVIYLIMASELFLAVKFNLLCTR